MKCSSGATKHSKRQGKRTYVFAVVIALYIYAYIYRICLHTY